MAADRLTRIQKTTVTDTLLQAIEEADDIEAVAVLYYRKDRQHAALITSQNMKNTELNWLLDRAKLWLLGAVGQEEEG